MARIQGMAPDLDGSVFTHVTQHPPLERHPLLQVSRANAALQYVRRNKQLAPLSPPPGGSAPPMLSPTRSRVPSQKQSPIMLRPAMQPQLQPQVPSQMQSPRPVGGAASWRPTLKTTSPLKTASPLSRRGGSGDWGGGGGGGTGSGVAVGGDGSMGRGGGVDCGGGLGRGGGVGGGKGGGMGGGVGGGVCALNYLSVSLVGCVPLRLAAVAPLHVAAVSPRVPRPLASI